MPVSPTVRTTRPTEEKVRILADKMEPVILEKGDRVSKGVTRNVTLATARVLLSGARPTQMAFLARALNAVAALTSDLDEKVLSNASGATSDYDVLVQVLGAPEALGALLEPSPLAEARTRGLLARSNLLQAEGGPLTVETVAKLLGITRQAVDKRRRAGKLIGLDTGKRGYLYPSWQFDQRGVLPGLPLVLETMNVQDPWMQVAFFLNGSNYLNGATPLAELRQEHVESVFRAGQAYGEHGSA